MVEQLSNIFVCVEVLFVDIGCKTVGAMVSQQRDRLQAIDKSGFIGLANMRDRCSMKCWRASVQWLLYTKLHQVACHRE